MMKCLLGDVARSIQTGPFGSQLHQSDYTDCGTPVVMPKDVVNGDIVDTSIACVGPQHVSRLSRHQLRPGNLIFSRRGDVGRCALVKKEQNGWLCGTGCLRVVVDEEKIDSSYLYYFLCQSDVAKWLESHAVGAIMLNINPSIVSQIPISFPTRGAQEQIANLLSALDRKIALNRRKIATLEKMAKEIYDYWFVQYDFPDANGRPYKSSGGEMVYSPELKREIPKGWKVGCLGDVVDINKRSHNVRTLPEHINYIDISSTQCGFVGTPTVYSRDEVPGRARRIAVDGDVVWSCVRPNLKAFALILSPKDEDVFSTGFAVLSPREIPYSYLYCATSADSFVSYLVAKTGNSAYPAVLPGDFKLYQLSLPPSDILEAFHDSAGPLFRRRQRCFDEISKLTALRDFLLPLLMNGQTRIGGADE